MDGGLPSIRSLCSKVFSATQDGCFSPVKANRSGGIRFFCGEDAFCWNQRERDSAFPRILFYHNGAIFFAFVLAFSWLRRGARTVGEVGATIAGVFCLFYAATNYWSFQYFAWAVPFYFFLDWKRCLSLIVVSSTYIYGLYAYFCESWLLSGNWEFIAHSAWPRPPILSDGAHCW